MIDIDEASMLEKLVNKMTDGTHSGDSLEPFMVSVGRMTELFPEMIKELRAAREVVEIVEANRKVMMKLVEENERLTEVVEAARKYNWTPVLLCHRCGNTKDSLQFPCVDLPVRGDCMNVTGG